MKNPLFLAEINRQIGRLYRIHGISITSYDFSEMLGYPIAEANFDRLMGIIIALDAINTNAEHDCRGATVSRPAAPTTPEATR